MNVFFLIFLPFLVIVLIGLRAYACAEKEPNEKVATDLRHDVIAYALSFPLMLFGPVIAFIGLDMGILNPEPWLHQWVPQLIFGVGFFLGISGLVLLIGVGPRLLLLAIRD